MVNIRSYVCSSALIAALAWTGPAASQTVITASSFLPATNTVTQNALVRWGTDVERVTGGRVKVNLLSKAVAAPQGTVDAIREGLSDVSWAVHGLTPARFILTRIAEMPLLGDNGEQISVAYQRIHDRHLHAAGEHKGLKVLAVFTHGPGQILTSRKPLASLEDLAGLKLRVPGGVPNDVTLALGMVPVLKPASEVYELVSTGVVDGVLFPFEGIVNFKMERIIKHATLIPGGLYNSSFVLMMNQGKFDSLSKQDQEAILSVSGEVVARRVGKYFDQGDKAGLDSMRANNNPVSPASGQFLQALRTKTAQVESAWYKEAEGRGVDGRKALADFRAEIGKVQIQ